jgi:RNA polymerase sigma-70 factor (ECF subfamily)
MEYREIAQTLKVPEGTVKSRLNRGRAELARVLRRRKVVV